MAIQVSGVIFDVDGTLIDSNDAHAMAWVEAMCEFGHTVSFEKLRPLIGMGGDKVLPSVLNITKDSKEGQQISQCRKEIFKTRYLPIVKAFPLAAELLEHMHARRLKLVVATSAEPDELESFLHIIGPHVSELFENITDSSDVKSSKPDADLVKAALQCIHYSANEVVMIGDTAYDIESAAKVNVRTIALRSGGWKDQELAGAVAIYSDPADLLVHYNSSPLTQGLEIPIKG